MHRQFKAVQTHFQYLCVPAIRLLLEKPDIIFGIILFFAIGAGIGGNLSMLFGIHTIWISSALLSISVLLMFAEKLKNIM